MRKTSRWPRLNRSSKTTRSRGRSTRSASSSLRGIAGRSSCATSRRSTRSTSSASARGDGETMDCPYHPVALVPAILKVHFPKDSLPVNGWKCPECGEEVLTGEQAARAQAAGRRLGLFGPEQARIRKALKIGSSVGLTLDPEQARELGITPGTRLEV